MQILPTAPSPYPSLKPALVFVIFLVVGPLLGTLIFLVGAPSFGIIAAPHSTGFSMPRGIQLENLKIAALISYAAGGAQASVVGTIGAMFQSGNRKGLVPLVPVVIASLITAFLLMTFLSMWFRDFPDARLMLFFLAIHLGAGGGCWIISNAILRGLTRIQLAHRR